MRTVYKFRLENLTSGPPVDIVMPKGARILTLQLQGGGPCIWVLVDPDAPPETRTFHVLATGQEIEGSLGEYVGTYQQGFFVWHVFETYRDLS
jgi:hypothetical protein